MLNELFLKIFTFTNMDISLNYQWIIFFTFCSVTTLVTFNLFSWIKVVFYYLIRTLAWSISKELWDHLFVSEVINTQRPSFMITRKKLLWISHALCHKIYVFVISSEQVKFLKELVSLLSNLKAWVWTLWRSIILDFLSFLFIKCQEFIECFFTIFFS